MKKFILAVAVVCATFAMTSCNKCTSCKVKSSGDLGKYEKTFGNASDNANVSAEDCAELKKQAKEYVESTNKMLEGLGVDGKLSFHCN